MNLLAKGEPDNLDIWPFPGSDKLVLHRRARIGFDTLSEEDRRLIRETAESLVGKPSEHWPELGVPRLPNEEAVYLLRVSSDLLALVCPFRDRVEVLDLVRAETLRLFANTGQPNGKEAEG